MGEFKTNRIVKGALLLTAAGFISKLLSAGYRIPLQNLTGDLGFYIYQQIYPFLGTALILSLYGFPSAVSKLSAKRLLDGKALSYQSFYLPLFLLLLCINGSISLVLFAASESIAQSMGDPHLAYAIRLSAIPFLLVPFTSLFRGVFQGHMQMKPTALSQVSEQFIRVILIIAAAIILVQSGRDVYDIGQAAVIAAVAGAIGAIIILLVFFQKQRPFGSQKKAVPTAIPWKHYISVLVIFGLAASLNHMLLLIIQFADAFTLVPNLIQHGLTSKQAMLAKGVFDRGIPLIQLGTVVGSSFALALVPAVSWQRLKENAALFYRDARTALACSIYLSFGAALGLIIIFPDVNIVLFENDAGTSSLQVLSLAVLLSSIAITICSVLQGLGYMKRTAVFILAALLVKWGLNQLLVPLWGITGAALATVLCLFLLCVIVIIDLQRKLPELAFWKQINPQALIAACLGMTVYLFLCKWIMQYIAITGRMELLVYTIFLAATGAIVYIVLLLRWNAFTTEQIDMLPIAGIAGRIHKRRKPDEWKN